MMELADSGEMTPPCSPFTSADDSAMDVDELAQTKYEARQSVNHVICFKCQTCQKSTHPDSYLQRGCLDKLLGVQGSSNEVMSGEAVMCFGHWIFPACMDLQQTETCFALARQHISQLEQMASQRPSSFLITDNEEQGLATRKNLRRLFNVFHAVLMQDTEVIRDEVVEKVLSSLHELFLFFGALSFEKHTKGSATYHLSHLQLEIYLGCMELQHIITTRFPNVTHQGASLFDQSDWEGFGCRDVVTLTVELLLRQVIHRAAVILPRTADAGGNWLKQSPWSCGCVQEMLVWIVHLLQHRQRTSACPSFWVVFTPLLQQVLDVTVTNESAEPAEAESSYVFRHELHGHLNEAQRRNLCWWLVLHAARLYGYNSHGLQVKQYSPQSSNHSFLSTLLNRSLSQSEADFRRYMYCVIEMSSVWEASTSVLGCLIAYFTARMNESFLVSGGRLTSFMTPRQSARGILDRCKNYIGAEMGDNETSFDLFLRLVALELGKSGLKGTANPQWRQVKSRMYIKFHARRVSELTETGIHHLSLLFITLMLTADLHDAGNKLVELLGAVELAGTGRQRAVFTALFALVMLHIEENHCVGFLAEKLTAFLARLTQEMSRVTKSVQVEMWSCVELYMSSTAECFDMSKSLLLQEHQLLGQLLNDSYETTMRGVLEFTLRILTKFRNVLSCSDQDTSMSLTQHTALGNALWEHFYPPLCDMACRSSRSPEILADVASAFISLAAVRILTKALQDKKLLSQLDMSDLDAKLIQVWLRCSLNLPSSSKLISQLNSEIINIPRVKEIFTQAWEDSAVCSETSPELFFESLNRIYTMKQDLRERSLFRESIAPFFAGVGQHVSAILRDPCPPQDVLKSLLLTTGHLVEHCSPLIYTRSGSDSLLPVLLDKLLIPRKLAAGAEQSTPLAAVRDQYAHLFISGLRLLDLKRDPYLNRKLKEVIVHYAKSSSEMNLKNSPILHALEGGCRRNVPPQDSMLHHCVVKMIASELLVVTPGKTPPHVLQALTFLFHLLSNTESQTQLSMNVPCLLLPCLQLILQSDTPAVRAAARQCLSVTLSHLDPSKTSQHSDILSGFIRERLPVDQGHLISALDTLADISPSLLIAVIPSITQAVKLSEGKRGVGIDRQLRGSYCSLLMKLGPDGAAEKSSILREAL